jgi:hypothetical protein
MIIIYLRYNIIFKLEREEKFQTVDGQILEIETRGERHSEKIFFRVRDVMIAFEMPTLIQSLLHITSNYERGVDFVTFTRESLVVNHYQRLSSKRIVPNKNPLYLTYDGMLRVLFCSRIRN